jgi:hypothetical protein
LVLAGGGAVNPLDLVPGWVKLAILAALASAVLGFIGWQVHHQRDVGRDEIRAEWNADKVQQQAAALAEAEANAKETLRRLTRQKENQDANDQELMAARRDAARNGSDADQLREQNADIARKWRDALRDSPAGSQCQAAGDAIGVLADVLGRVDRRAGVLAAYADAARAAGLKCERDYDALKPSP